MLQDVERVDRSFDPFVPPGLLLQISRLWQTPIIAATAWWNAMIDLCWPRPPVGHHQPCHDEHDQLVVPDPIEAEGEHALFA